ncbi:MAG: PTS sugar transporter subunit IIA [Erysipelotrichaceae bacterium]
MLRDFVERNHIDFFQKFETWQEAIAGSCKRLIDEGVLDPEYVDEIIANVNEYGPYIIIAPNVAMPHSTLGGNHVHGTTISFTKVEEPVVFDPDDESKNARLFFTLAATSNEEHLANMIRLTEMLMIDGVIDELLEVNSVADILSLAERIEKFEKEE